MPRLDQDVKLDFKDVLFRPKRSTLKSRSEVYTSELERSPLYELLFLGGFAQRVLVQELKRKVQRYPDDCVKYGHCRHV